jgi:Leucine-rich repeat (LRR) protein
MNYWDTIHLTNTKTYFSQIEKMSLHKQLFCSDKNNKMILPLDCLVNVLEFFVENGLDLTESLCLSRDIYSELSKRPIHFVLRLTSADIVSIPKEQKHRITNIKITGVTKVNKILDICREMSITRLDCSWNNLEGNIPVIAGIKYLDCSGNQLSGNIPVIPGIKELYCFKNDLSGNILVIHGIKTLDCSDNQLSGNIPVIHGIKTFDCSWNHTKGASHTEGARNQIFTMFGQQFV